MSRPQGAKLHHARSRLEDARFAFDHARNEMAVNHSHHVEPFIATVDRFIDSAEKRGI